MTKYFLVLLSLLVVCGCTPGRRFSNKSKSNTTPIEAPSVSVPVAIPTESSSNTTPSTSNNPTNNASTNNTTQNTVTTTPVTTAAPALTPDPIFIPALADPTAVISVPATPNPTPAPTPTPTSTADTFKFNLLTRQNRSLHGGTAGAMDGGWGPHLRGLLRDGKSRLWFAFEKKSASVNNAETVTYMRLDNGVWNEIASQAYYPTVQQNAAHILSGQFIYSYGVNITGNWMEECYFDTENPSYKACNAITNASFKVIPVAVSSNYVGATVSPKGKRVVWWTTVGNSGAAGSWSYIYHNGTSWLGPFTGPINLEGVSKQGNDYAYVFAQMLNEEEIVITGQALTGNYAVPSSCMFYAAFAKFKLGQIPSLFSVLGGAEGGANFSLTKGFGTSEALWVNPVNEDIHIIARAFDGRLGYFHIPQNQIASPATRTAKEYFPYAYRAAFMEGAKKLRLLLGNNTPPARVDVYSIDKALIAGAIPWSKITLTTLPPLPEEGFFPAGALWVESSSRQTTPSQGLDFAFSGSYYATSPSGGYRDGEIYHTAITEYVAPVVTAPSIQTSTSATPAPSNGPPPYIGNAMVHPSSGMILPLYESKSAPGGGIAFNLGSGNVELWSATQQKLWSVSVGTGQMFPIGDFDQDGWPDFGVETRTPMGINCGTTAMVKTSLTLYKGKTGAKAGETTVLDDTCWSFPPTAPYPTSQWTNLGILFGEGLSTVLSSPYYATTSWFLTWTGSAFKSDSLYYPSNTNYKTMYPAAGYIQANAHVANGLLLKVGDSKRALFFTSGRVVQYEIGPLGPTQLLYDKAVAGRNYGLVSLDPDETSGEVSLISGTTAYSLLEDVKKGTKGYDEWGQIERHITRYNYKTNQIQDRYFSYAYNNNQADKYNGRVAYPNTTYVKIPGGASRLAYNVFTGGRWELHISKPGTLEDQWILYDQYLWDIADLKGDGTQTWIVSPSPGGYFPQRKISFYYWSETDKSLAIQKSFDGYLPWLTHTHRLTKKTTSMGYLYPVLSVKKDGVWQLVVMDSSNQPKLIPF